MNGGKYYFALKRLIDIITSAVGLLFLSPVLAGLAAVIVLYSPGPVFYFSRRVGRRGVPFKMWKFRSMIPNADRAGSSVTTNDDPRITPIGRVLRRSKLDELPSLFNVLRGDMSLVGPRPETPRWVQLYTTEMRSVLDTRPGVTDVAQVIFRHEEQMLKGQSVDEQQYLAVMRWKVALQQEYLCRRSLLIDAKVLMHTFRAILNRAPDPELESLVARANSVENPDLPDLLRARANNIFGTGATRSSSQSHVFGPDSAI